MSTQLKINRMSYGAHNQSTPTMFGLGEQSLLKIECTKVFPHQTSIQIQKHYCRSIHEPSIFRRRCPLHRFGAYVWLDCVHPQPEIQRTWRKALEWSLASDVRRSPLEPRHLPWPLCVHIWEWTSSHWRANFGTLCPAYAYQRRNEGHRQRRQGRPSSPILCGNRGPAIVR